MREQAAPLGSRTVRRSGTPKRTFPLALFFMLLAPVLALGACYPVGGLDGGPPAAETRGASGCPSMAKTTAVALFAYVGRFGTHPGNASGTRRGSARRTRQMQLPFSAT